MDCVTLAMAWVILLPHASKYPAESEAHMHSNRQLSDQIPHKLRYASDLLGCRGFPLLRVHSLPVQLPEPWQPPEHLHWAAHGQCTRVWRKGSGFSLCMLARFYDPQTVQLLSFCTPWTRTSCRNSGSAPRSLKSVCSGLPMRSSSSSAGSAVRRSTSAQSLTLLLLTNRIRSLGSFSSPVCAAGMRFVWACCTSSAYEQGSSGRFDAHVYAQRCSSYLRMNRGMRKAAA